MYRRVAVGAGHVEAADDRAAAGESATAAAARDPHGPHRPARQPAHPARRHHLLRQGREVQEKVPAAGERHVPWP